MFCGSIGKTWFASVALRLVKDRKLQLDDKIAQHLGDEPWFARLPNHDTITIRQLIVEKLTKTDIYELVQEHVITKHGQQGTVPGNQRHIPGLVQGHVRMFGRFGFPERSLQKGKLQFDPSSEWCGGGIVTTAADLANWARIYGSDKRRRRDAVAADRLGEGTKYGLGVMLRDSELGPTRGHDGVFIGYCATMMWFEKHDIAVSVLVNTDSAGRHLLALAVDLVKAAKQSLAKK